MNLNIVPEIREVVLQWCLYHYKGNLAGLAFFEPRAASADYPRGDINLLLLLYHSPDEDRKRYDKVTQVLVNNLVLDKDVVCRVQTVDELNLLVEMKLPLLAIYLQHAEIIYDPQGILCLAQSTLMKQNSL
jgi:hypothetical protein